MSQSARLKVNQSKLRANEKKWGVLLVEAGWTMVPSTILEHQEALGIDPVDMNILMQLARYWWKVDNPPHPSIKTIAACIGKSPSTVQRRITKMKEARLIEVEHRHDSRHNGQMSSLYHFQGLIKKASELAKTTIEKREAGKSGKHHRKVRSRTKLRVADGTTPDAG